MEETKLSGETNNPTPPVEETNPLRTHWEWKERIREDAIIAYPESWIFEEYNEDCMCYNFYYYDLDGEVGCMSLKEKDIKRFYLFLQKNKAEERYRQHNLNS